MKTQKNKNTQFNQEDTTNPHLLSIALIETEDGMQDIAESWNGLWEHMQNRSIFQRFEWMDAAWQWARSNSQLWIFTLHERDKNQLVGIFPLVLQQERHRGLSVQVAKFLSVPDNQLCDAIIHPDYIEPSITAFVNALVERKHDWDILQLNLLPQQSLLFPRLAEACNSAGLATNILQTAKNPVFSLEGTWQDFYSRRSRRLKKGNNLVANRLKKNYKDIHIEWFSEQNITDAEPENLLSDIVQISERSWKEDTGKTLDQPGPRSFIKRLTAHALNNKWLSIWLLYLNGDPVAGEYQIIHEGKIHALRSDYDMDFAQDSPGTFLNWKLMEKLFGNSFNQYLMGPGENPYKLRWAEEFDLLYQYTAYGHTLRGRTLQVLEKYIVPMSKKIRSKLYKFHSHE